MEALAWSGIISGFTIQMAELVGQISQKYMDGMAYGLERCVGAIHSAYKAHARCRLYIDDEELGEDGPKITIDWGVETCWGKEHDLAGKRFGPSPIVIHSASHPSLSRKFSYMISQRDGRLCETSGHPCVGRATKRFVASGLTVILSLGLLSGCGDAGSRSVRLGTYVSQLCEAVGPFERDARTFGKILSQYTLRLKSRKSKREMERILVALVEDSRHTVATLEAVGTPNIGNGQALAASTIQTFKEIAKSDAVWRYELLGPWVWPDRSASRAKRKRVRTSLTAFLAVGRQFERFPGTREGEEAMARSPVCRELLGPVRLGPQESNRNARSS